MIFAPNHVRNYTQFIDMQFPWRNARDVRHTNARAEGECQFLDRVKILRITRKIDGAYRKK